MISKKILFLDIDGVLNSHRSSTANKALPHNVSPENLKWFDWIAVGMVRRLCDEHGAEIVLSSSWRILHDYREIGTALDLPIVDQTDTELGTRGQQIQRWLDAHQEIENYVIVDDDSDMLMEQAPRFVQTHFSDGLLYEHYKAISDILDGRRTTGLYRNPTYWLNHPPHKKHCTVTEIDDDCGCMVNEACKQKKDGSC